MSNGIQNVSDLQIGLIGMGEVSAAALSYECYYNADLRHFHQMGKMYARRLAAGGMKKSVGNRFRKGATSYLHRLCEPGSASVIVSNDMKHFGRK